MDNPPWADPELAWTQPRICYDCARLAIAALLAEGWDDSPADVNASRAHEAEERAGWPSTR